MRKVGSYPISKRLTGMNLLVSGTALLLACAAFFGYDIVSYRASIVRGLSIQAQIVASNSISAIVFNDPHSAEVTLSAFRASPHVISAEIYTLEGQPFAGYWRDNENHVPPPAPRLKAGAEESFYFTNGKVVLVRRIIFQGKPIGVVAMQDDLQVLYDRLRTYAIIVAIVLLISMLAALLVSSVSQRVISQPVIQLAEMARAISREKNYSVRAPTPGDQNEISTLVQAFNDMLAQIQQRDSALQQAHDELEMRVKERTAELQEAEEKLRKLSNRLLQLRDEERRQIARELHDSSGQNLVALSINLSMLQAQAESWGPKAVKGLNDSLSLVKTVLQEVRTISYLLHPPLLDDAGLESALRWFVDGFVERSNIAVTLELPPDLGRLPMEVETALFRVVQESLTNIHRHSGSVSASIRVVREQTKIRLEISDKGRGMSPNLHLSESRPGVGISGMQERLRQLGGQLQIHSGSEGTTVIAELPLHSEAQAQS
jgi:signal transduction histidine kinase